MSKEHYSAPSCTISELGSQTPILLGSDVLTVLDNAGGIGEAGAAFEENTDFNATW